MSAAFREESHEGLRLPDGWSISERGPISPEGRCYTILPAGYEWEDVPIFDAIMKEWAAFFDTAAWSEQ